MSADRISASLAELDPESRALLELSMVRGIPDDDLASMLGGDAQRLRQRRRAVLESLGVESPAERAALVGTLRGEEPPPEAEPPREAEPPPKEPAGDGPSPGRGPRRLVWALAGGLMIAAVVALALALGSNGDGPENAGPAGPAPEPGARATAPVRVAPVKLDPLGGSPGRATAQIVVGDGDPKLRLRVRGLPRVSDGGYVVWLYNSVSEAQELSGSRAGTFSVNPPLPPEADRYRFLEISREPADGNRNHSGASVMRVPIEKIPRASR
ncbi:MAG: anti-sigma factor [Thermoleophilaceae bacterium]